MYWPVNCQLEKNALRLVECSIMKAVELPNYSGNGKALEQPGAEDGYRRNQPDGGVGGHQGHDRSADHHQLDR